ncbi:hypothetical protein [Xanthomonas campestris]|uniref:hypothetical protein n=1 Tax=Xanthomonas campestris TaxID=339 RepID=UPI002368D9AA|nr:hypothetical protein [Xanthomonas campestris]WDI91920.1 hypothetical protein JH280_11280 [Xanthomonas campestris]
MAGPWERFAAPQASPQPTAAPESGPPADGPWARFQPQAAPQPAADFSNVTSSVDTTANRPAAPEVAKPYEGSAFNQLVDFFAGPAPIQGATPEARQQDYRSRPAALRATVGVGQSIDSLVRGVGQLTGTSTAAMDDAGRATSKMVSGDLPTFGGKVATDLAMMAAPGGVVGQIPKMAARVGASALAGAGFGAVQAENAPGERVVNTIAGGLGGGAGEVAGTALRALGSKLSPEILAIYNAAKQRGIQMTPAQLSNSQFLQRMQGMLKSVPFTGTAQAFEKQVEQFNRAVSKTFGEDAPKITPDVFAAAKSRVGDQFDQLSAQSTLQIDDALLNRLGEIQKEAVDLGEPGTQRAVGSMIDRLLAQAQGSQLPGGAYKSIDSQLGKIMSLGGEKSYYLGQVRDAVREAMDNSIAPAMKDAWTAARSQYRSLKTVEPLVAKSVDGALPPAQLMGRVTADKSGKAAMASGRGGELGQLARIGQAMKAPSSSGSAENFLAGGVFNPANWPAFIAGGTLGVAGGRMLTSNRLAELMANSTTRPAVLNELARLAGPTGITLGRAASPAVAPVEPKPSRRDNTR